MGNGDGKVILREIEMFKIKRGYEELVVRVNIERIVNNEDLLCAVNVDDYFDDNAVDNKHLPGDRIGVLVADDDYDDEMITYL